MIKPSRKIIFYCDNDYLYRRTTEEVLINQYNIRTFKNGYDLLNCIKNGTLPHVILINFDSLNNTKELILVKQIRQLCGNIVIVAVTKDKNSFSYKDLFDYNFYEAIIKPFNGDLLMKKVNNAIRESRLVSNESSEFLMVLTFANLEELRDKLTRGHNARLGLISYELSKELGCNSHCCNSIKVAAALHDVGKHGIPEKILNKDGKLTNCEFNIIKSHTSMGYQILNPISKMNIDSLLMAAEIALKHHEKLDGSGYPSNLTKDQIPTYVRIVTMADIYDACTAKRTYHDSRTHNIGMDILNEEVKNGYLDSKIFNVFNKISDKINKIVSTYDYSEFSKIENVIIGHSMSTTCLECQKCD